MGSFMAWNGTARAVEGCQTGRWQTFLAGYREAWNLWDWMLLRSWDVFGSADEALLNRNMISFMFLFGLSHTEYEARVHYHRTLRSIPQK